MSEILIEVNGKKYQGFTNAECACGVESMARKFRFKTTAKSVSQNDLKAQDAVKIYIDGNKFLTGKIERLRISYDATNHDIEVSGRDKIGDLIDSSIVQKEYAQRDFVSLLKAVLKDNGYSDIGIVDNVGKISRIHLEEGETVKTEKGETIAEFLDRYAQKVQVLLFSDEDGDLTISREGDQQAIGAILSQIGNSNSNVLSASIDLDMTERYRYIEIFAQSGNDSFSISSVDQSATAIDDEVIYPRRKRITQGTASKTLTLSDWAKWNVVIRKAKGSRYQCRLQDFYAAGKLLWEMNTLAMVKDERCQIDGQFLIQGLTFTKTNQGTFTDLSIVNRGSFSLLNQKLTNSGNFGKNLIRTS